MVLAAKPRIREIGDCDLDLIGDLLTRGFAFRPREYWMRGLRRLADKPIPPGVPRYGYMLESEGAPVGCLLLIYSSRTFGGETVIRCNVSSWYVDPEFRNYAALFASMAQKRKDVTYFNVTPALHTWPILQAQGFETYCRGSFFSGPSLSGGGHGMKISAIKADTEFVSGLPDSDFEMLKRHAEYGCISLVCHTNDAMLPFIFIPLRKRRGFIPMPAVLLGYCNSIADYVRCAGAIGRHLLWRGKPVVIVDANEPIPGLKGFYREPGDRRYFKGPHRIELGDLADTELAIFGL
jgi:hypothetical protein